MHIGLADRAAQKLIMAAKWSIEGGQTPKNTFCWMAEIAPEIGINSKNLESFAQIHVYG